MEDKQYLKIGEALIGEEQIMEMAAYINHLETENAKIMEELKASKAYLSATIQQRNSATNKLRTVLENKINTIDITNIPVQSAEFEMVGELTNPEQWAVPEGKVSKITKSNKI
jgi:predicted RNase H-like nuclease (RuvC/YqgF family)